MPRPKRIEPEKVVKVIDTPIEALLTVDEVCQILKIARKTVITARSKGGHPLFDKGFCPLGPSAGLRFFRDDVIEFLDSCRIAS